MRSLSRVNDGTLIIALADISIAKLEFPMSIMGNVRHLLSNIIIIKIYVAHITHKLADQHENIEKSKAWLAAHYSGVFATYQ